MTLCRNKNSDCRGLAFCLGNRVGNQQLVDVVIKFLGDHPEKRDNVAFVLIGEALKITFPCAD